MSIDSYLIEPAELLERLGDPNLRLFDSTIMFYMGISPEEAAKMPSAHQVYLDEHLPGAAFFDHLEFSDADSRYEYMLAPDEALAAEIGRLGISNTTEVIVYATSLLVSATRAWWVLRYAGVENLRILNGGLPAWKEAGGSTEQGENHYPETVFVPKFRPEMFASLEEVQAAIGNTSILIENTLMHDWYNQEHIPGSVCTPLTDLTIGWDTLRPEPELVKLLSTGKNFQRIITYCGGGIAASLNAVAYLIAGHPDVAVYDGSLFEWKGESMPIESSD